MDTPILDFLRQYSEHDWVRFHMPGHKGKGMLGCEKWDITEVYGGDALYEADGIIAKSERKAAELFGTQRTCYSTEGSSQCIRAMLYLALNNRPKGNSNVIVAARNVHKTFVYAAALLDIEPVWLWPESSSSLCGCPVTPAILKETLNKLDAPPAAVYVTSPDYLGEMADMGNLAKVCHDSGTILLVDNAHGAYLKFLPKSLDPLDLGADMCCDSAHKTLPVLTGGAYLHVAEGAMAAYEAEARHSLAVFGSSSPSYLILQSLDLCADRLDKDYPALIRETARRAAVLSRELGLAPSEGDPLKLALPAGDFGCTGPELAACLRDWRTAPEYVDAAWVVLMFTPGLDEGAYDTVRRALPLRRPSERRPQSMPEPGERVLSPREALLSRRVSVPVREAVGRVCAEAAVSCPPAIPIAVCGERISPEAAALMEKLGVCEVSVAEGLE